MRDINDAIFRIKSWDTLWQFWTGPFGHFVLPGLVLPALVTLAICLARPQSVWQFRRSIFACMILGIVGNSLYAYAWSGDRWGMPTFWWFATPLLINQMRFAVTAPPGQDPAQRMTACTAFAGTWLTLFPGDLVCGYVWKHFHPDELLGQSAFLPLALVGGAGWKDGLLQVPLYGVLFVTLVVPLLTAIYRHPRYQAYRSRQRSYQLMAFAHFSSTAAKR